MCPCQSQEEERGPVSSRAWTRTHGSQRGARAGRRGQAGAAAPFSLPSGSLASVCFSATLHALPSRTANFCTPEMPAPAAPGSPPPAQRSAPALPSALVLSGPSPLRIPLPPLRGPAAGGGGLASYRVRWRPRSMGSVSDLVGLQGSCCLVCCRGPASRWLAGCGGRSGRGEVGVTPCTASRSPGRSRSQPRGLSTLAPDFGTRGQYET